MAIAQLERPQELDDLGAVIERGSDRLRQELAGIADAADTIAEQADRAVSDLGSQAEELGAELEQGMRRVMRHARGPGRPRPGGRHRHRGRPVRAHPPGTAPGPDGPQAILQAPQALTASQQARGRCAGPA